MTDDFVPATVTRRADDRVGLDFLNPRGDELDVIQGAIRILATPDR
jgi:hypothetical protein